MDFALHVYGAASRISGMLVDATITPVVGNSYTCKVGFSEATEMVLAGEVIASAPYIEFASVSLPLLSKGDGIIIKAKSFKIASIERLHDGAESKAELIKA